MEALRKLSSQASKTGRKAAKARHQLPLASHNILQDWLREHLDNPYPTNDEKASLSTATGLTIKQVSTWFTNSRQRQLGPLEQWLSSGSEDESALPEAITAALQHHVLPTPDLTPKWTQPYGSEGSGCSADSAFSQCGDAVRSGPARRGRKTYANQLRDDPPRNALGEMVCKFQDTCSELHFERRCEWSKHMDKHDRPYKCQKPGCELLLGFTYSGGLLRHQREVHGEHGGRKKVLHCPKENCKRHSGSGFTREENLEEHMRRVHRVDLATPDSKSEYDAFASSVSSAGSAMSPGSDVVPFGSYRRDRKAHRQDAISLQEENAGLNIRIKKVEDELHDLKNLIRELQSPLDGFVGGKRKRSRESSPAAGIIENPSTDSEGRSILHRASFDTMETSSHPDGSAPSQHMVLALDCHAESATRDLVKGVGRPSHVKFQCTFCRLQLTEKAWKRHEEKQHLPRSQWTCMAQGSRYERNGESERVFCQSTSNVDQLQHQGCHRIADCMAKPKRERTFTRRDNLIQHLKGFHQAIPCEEVIASWEFQADHSHHAWSCGFCGETLDDWDTRAAHTAKHFRNGITMSSWDSNRVTGDEDEKESEALLIVPMTSPFLLKHQSDRSAESTRDGDLLDLDGTNIDAAGSGTNQVPCDNVTWTALQKDPGLTLQSTDHGYWPPEPDPSYLMGLEMDIPMPDSDTFADFGNVEEWLNVDLLDDTESTIDLAANADSQSIFSPAVDTACVPETEDGLSEFREGLDGWEELPRTSNEEVIRPAGDEEDLAAELVATKVKLQKLESELSKVKQVEVMYYYAMGT